MDQLMRRGRFVVGEYVVGKQLGSGSFSTVWHARHRVHGTQVAIKEIGLSRLNTKLQESLRSEIVILKRINNPNIIRLHDMIEEAGKMYIVLEFCKGGDLSIFIQRRQGRIPEPLAKHFMQQLASGLKILRENNIIHRDLKPQNLLLSTDDDDSVLKIADFGFARSLQPSGLADTLCGSPLYMAPEIMQLQKYDAKADLWSVGAILFQIVTGKTPFTGSNQMQLLQNIVKSTELHFPSDAKNLSTECMDLCRKLLCRNPVERLTFEEFFNHPFLSQRQTDELLRKHSPRIVDSFQFSHCNSAKKTVETSQEDCFPFILDDDSSGPDGSPFSKRSSMQSTYGFSLDMKADTGEVSNNSDNVNLTSKQSSVRYKLESTGPRVDNSQSLERNPKKSLITLDLGTTNNHSKVVDPLELIDQDYVLVSDPAMDSSNSISASTLNQFPPKSGSSSVMFGNLTPASSAPVPIIGSTSGKSSHFGSLGSHVTAHSQGLVDTGVSFDQPSTDCMTRIKSLQHCASVIKELVVEKFESGRELEAFSIQLVILAIWKQALRICHTHAASAIEGSQTKEVVGSWQTCSKRIGSSDNQECLDIATTEGSQDICSQIERAFLRAVGNAEDLAKVVEPGNMEMPDAMETIYQSALALGRHGAVDEYMGDAKNAAGLYSKAVQLLLFLLVEAPSLILNPPFSLTNSDRYRLQTYIDSLNNRRKFFKVSENGSSQV